MSYLRDHQIEMLNGVWVYSDTKEPTVENHHKRPCGHCGLQNTDEGHDGCLGTLPGIMNACCGHGRVGGAYVQFLDGVSVHEEDAAAIFNILKKY